MLLTAVAAESVSELWLKTETSIVKVEDNEKEQKKETEKEENKDKLFQQASLFQNETNKQSLFVLLHTYFKSSSFLSLPEIPPELA